MEGTLIESPDSPDVFWHYMDMVPVKTEYFLEQGVRIYWDLGLASINGRMFKIDKEKTLPDYYTNDEMKMNIALAKNYSIRRLAPTYYTLGPAAAAWSCLSHQVGLYVLLFSSVWKKHMQCVGILHNSYLRLYTWMPGLKTCNQLLVRLQRAWRRRQKARRSLALGMAFHCRLGEDAGVACLGADLYRLICGGL